MRKILFFSASVFFLFVLGAGSVSADFVVQLRNPDGDPDSKPVTLRAKYTDNPPEETVIVNEELPPAVRDNLENFRETTCLRKKNADGGTVNVNCKTVNKATKEGEEKHVKDAVSNFKPYEFSHYPSNTNGIEGDYSVKRVLTRKDAVKSSLLSAVDDAVILYDKSKPGKLEVKVYTVRVGNDGKEHLGEETDRIEKNKKIFVTVSAREKGLGPNPPHNEYDYRIGFSGHPPSGLHTYKLKIAPAGDEEEEDDNDSENYEDDKDDVWTRLYGWDKDGKRVTSGYKEHLVKAPGSKGEYEVRALTDDNAGNISDLSEKKLCVYDYRNDECDLSGPPLPPLPPPPPRPTPQICDAFFCAYGDYSTCTEALEQADNIYQDGLVYSGYYEDSAGGDLCYNRSYDDSRKTCYLLQDNKPVNSCTEIRNSKTEIGKRCSGTAGKARPLPGEERSGVKFYVYRQGSQQRERQFEHRRLGPGEDGVLVLATNMRSFSCKLGNRGRSGSQDKSVNQNSSGSGDSGSSSGDSGDNSGQSRGFFQNFFNPSRQQQQTEQRQNRSNRRGPGGCDEPAVSGESNAPENNNNQSQPAAPDAGNNNNTPKLFRGLLNALFGASVGRLLK